MLLFAKVAQLTDLFKYQTCLRVCAELRPEQLWQKRLLALQELMSSKAAAETSKDERLNAQLRPQWGTWTALVAPKQGAMDGQVEKTKEGLLMFIQSKLSKDVSELQAFVGGKEKGQSWKSGLPAQASVSELAKQASGTLIKGAIANSLASGFRIIGQDSFRQ